MAKNSPEQIESQDQPNRISWLTLGLVVLGATWFILNAKTLVLSPSLEEKFVIILPFLVVAFLGTLMQMVESNRRG